MNDLNFICYWGLGHIQNVAIQFHMVKAKKKDIGKNIFTQQETFLRSNWCKGQVITKSETLMKPTHQMKHICYSILPSMSLSDRNQHPQWNKWINLTRGKAKGEYVKKNKKYSQILIQVYQLETKYGLLKKLCKKV